MWMLVTPENPLKPVEGLLPDNVRLEMVRLVCDALPGLRASDFEFSLSRPSFTYRTLCALREAYPEHSFTLAVGSDNWLIFNQWRDWQRIIAEFGLIVYPRPGYEIEPSSLPEGVRWMGDAPQMEISSSWIRGQIALGRDMSYFLPSAVYEYIRKHHLYE